MPTTAREVAEAIDAMSRDDLVWLTESFGVSFDGLDFSRLNGIGGSRVKPQNVESICEVEGEARAAADADAA